MLHSLVQISPNTICTKMCAFIETRDCAEICLKMLVFWYFGVFFGKCSIETIKYSRTLSAFNIIDVATMAMCALELEFKPPVDFIAWFVDFKFYLINTWIVQSCIADKN